MATITQEDCPTRAVAHDRRALKLHQDRVPLQSVVVVRLVDAVQFGSLKQAICPKPEIRSETKQTPAGEGVCTNFAGDYAFQINPALNRSLGEQPSAESQCKDQYEFETPTHL